MADLLSLTVLKRYRVDAFIVRGARADVYRVWDQQRIWRWQRRGDVRQWCI